MTSDIHDVLLISQDQSGASLIGEFLTESSEGTLNFTACTTPQDIRAYIEDKHWDTILVDQSLPNRINAPSFTEAFRSQAHAPVIVLCGHDDKNASLYAEEFGAQECVFLGKDDGKSIVKTIKTVAKNTEIKSSLQHSTSLLSTIMETSNEAIIMIEEDGRLARWNDGAERLFGYSQDEILGRPVWHLTHPTDKANLTALIANATQTDGAKLRNNMTVGVGLKKNGNAFPIEFGFGILQTDSTTVMIGIIRDITDKRVLGDIKRSSELVFDSITEGVMITDTNNKVTAVNRGFCEITGYDADEVIGKTPQILNSGYHDKAFFDSMKHCLETTGIWQGEIWNRRKNGEIFPEWLTIGEIRDEEGNLTQHVAVFSDVSKHQSSEEEVRERNNYDALTKLPNRSLLYDRLEQAIFHAKHSETKAVVQVIDLDFFDNINQTLGASEGDKVLRNMAARLASITDSHDTVARIGGDEFAIVLNDLSDIEDIINATTKSLSCMNEPLVSQDSKVYVTGSIGIAIYPDDGNTPDELLKKAHIALSKAKSSGRNTSQFFESQMMGRSKELTEIEYSLRNAIDNNEISIVYQPQVEANSGKVIGAEALVRWNSPEHGNVPPSYFIPIAEKCGMIRKLGTWVLETACRQQKIWRDSGYGHHRLAINISPIQFQDDDFPETVKRVLDKNGLEPQDIELELTESILIDKTERTRQQFLTLRELGIPLSMDDFGTGYSSLSYLKKFPIDTLKIDKSFIDDVATSSSDQAIVKAMIVMGQTLGLKIVCEGVEFANQCSFLLAEDCDIIQGYYFSKPIHASEFETLLISGIELG